MAASRQCSADTLRQALVEARQRSEQALLELGRRPAPQQRGAGQADLRYVTDSTVRAVPAANFHPPYLLSLETVELTLYGYCIPHQFGWERTWEAALSLRPPPVWHRLLRPAPLLALTFRSDADGTQIRITSAAPRRRCHGTYLLRLDPALQERLLAIHQQQLAATALPARLGAWLKRLRMKSPD